MDTAVAEQPEVVPVTVYVVVADGDASAVLVPVTVVPDDQVYVVPPLAERLAVWPAQMDGELTVTAGAGVTVTITGMRYVPGQVPA